MISRIDVDPPRPGAENMQRDLDNLHRVGRDGNEGLLVRLYRWRPAALSLGFHQSVEEIGESAFYRGQGIDVVMRPTGGRAVFHDAELTYSVAGRLDRGRDGSVLETYRWISGVLARALRAVGVSVREERRQRGRLHPRGSTVSPCFAAPSRYELLVGERKIVGSAQLRRRHAFLQHGSIPLRIDYPRMSRILGVSSSFLRKRIISVEEAAGREVSFQELAGELGRAFEQACPTGANAREA